MVVTLAAVAIYSGYTVTQLRGLRRLQAETIDRNRADSLLLLRNRKLHTHDGKKPSCRPNGAIL